jgi:glutaredoxin
VTEPPIKTPEEQVAEAERARILREEPPLEDEAPAFTQPARANEQQKREDEARDRARHEAVKKQLTAMTEQAARRDVVITLYSTASSGVSTLARNYMRAKNIPFTEFDVEQDEAARIQARALNPYGSVPTISVDGDIMIGFAPAWLEGRITRAAKKRASR